MALRQWPAGADWSSQGAREKIMKAITALILAALLLSTGCATTEKHEATLDTWLGSTEDELVAAWGIPDGTYQSGTDKYLIFQSRSAYTAAGVGDLAPTTYNLHCKTVFTITDRLVSNWQHQGNYCVAD